VALASRTSVLQTMCAYAGGSGFPPEMRAGSVSVDIVSVMLKRQSNYAKYF